MVRRGKSGASRRGEGGLRAGAATTAPGRSGAATDEASRARAGGEDSDSRPPPFAVHALVQLDPPREVVRGRRDAGGDRDGGNLPQAPPTCPTTG